MGGEEGETTVQLRRGFRAVASVVPIRLYEALVSFQREGGFRSRSQAVGEALCEWERLRRAQKPGLTPREGAWESSDPFGDGQGLKLEATREVALGPWQEVIGVVRELALERTRMRVVLEDADGPFALALSRTPRARELLVVGARVAILRTDDPAGDYVVRRPDAVARVPRPSDDTGGS